MSEPLRQHPLDPRAPDDRGLARPSSRPLEEDPLEELARILGETGGYPARPETTVEVGRRATPTKPMPQQLSALEAELFEELRSSVAPEDRVRGDFAREMPPVIPQRPVDDRDIASLRIDPRPAEEPTTAPAQTGQARQPETPWSDYYAYDEGVAAGSYDPAFAGMSAPTRGEAAWAPETGRGQGGGTLRPTFDDFGTADIAVAAQETSPYAAAEPVIRPHSHGEELAAARTAHEKPRSLVTTVVLTLGVLLAGGGAYAGWKAFGDKLAGGPVHITTDGKPMKVLPDPSKAPVADAEPSLKPDNGTAASKIVSLQEDPVEQVSGRTPEGKEVRVINPGAQRPAADQPHTVKTVIVRPDGSIVSDGGNAPVKTTTVTPVRVTPEVVPQPSAVPPTAAGSNTGAGPATVPMPSTPTAVPPVATDPVGRPVQAPLPVAAPPRPVATAPSTPAAVAPKPVAATPAPTAVPPKAASAGAPMALGPVAPRLASSNPPPAAAPTPITPPVAAAGASGEWMVQISASKSDADARRSFAEQSRRYSALAGRSLDVQTANLGDKGTFYRARVSAGTREQAAALCSQLQAQGGQCMVVKR